MPNIVCSTLILISCSKDNETIPDEPQQQTKLKSLEKMDQPQPSTMSLDAKSYEEIMDNLYGKEAYEIAEAVKVSDDDSDYDVKVVTKNKVDRGYLIDIDRGQDGIYENTIFVDHSVKNTDNITYYNIKDGIEQGFDMTADPNYPDKIDFDPTQPQPPLTNNKFIGVETDKSFIEKHPGDPDNHECTQIVTKTLYFCWIQVGESWPGEGDGATVDCPPPISY